MVFEVDKDGSLNEAANRSDSMVTLMLTGALLLGLFVFYALPDGVIKPVLVLGLGAFIASFVIVGLAILKKETIYLAAFQGMVLFIAGLSAMAACTARLGRFK